MGDNEETQAVVQAEKTSDKYRRWALYAAIGLAAALLYYHVNYSESIVLNINGEHIIVIIGIIGLFYYLFQKQQEDPRLPERGELAKKVAEWHYKHGYGVLDDTRAEVQKLTEKTALVWFPDVHKCFTYEAGTGITEERWQDIEEALIAREKSGFVKAFTTDVRTRDRIQTELERRGYTTK